MKSSEEYTQTDCRRTEFCGTFILKGQEDRAGRPRMTEKVAREGISLGKWFPESNNIDGWKDGEAVCDLEKSNFNGTMGVKV